MKKHRSFFLHKVSGLLLAILFITGLLCACGNTAQTNNTLSGNDSTAAAAASAAADSGTPLQETPESVSAQLDPTVVYKEGEETVLDTKDLSIVVTGYDPAYKENDADQEAYFVVKMRLKNKTKEEFNIEYDFCSVNRFGVEEPNFHKTDGEEDWYYFSIPAGEEVNAQLEFSNSCLVANGITSVNEIACSFKNGQTDKSFGIFTVYPTGMKPEEIVKADPFSEEDLAVLEDNNDFTFGIIKDSEKAVPMFWLGSADHSENYYYFYAENKTEKPLSFTLYKAAVNGFPYYRYYIWEDEDGNKSKEKNYITNIDEYSSESLLKCMPGCGAIGRLWVDDDFMKENYIGGMSGIFELSLGLSVDSSSDPLFSRTLSYVPEGSSPVSDTDAIEKQGYQTVDYVKEKQVIAENDYFKITAVGYEATYVGFLVRMEVENRTDQEYSYNLGNSFNHLAVNRLAGFPAVVLEKCIVPAGEKGELSVYIDTADFKKYNIRSVDELRFLFSAESADLQAARDAYYADYNNKKLSENYNALEDSDRHELYCAAFPTGLTEEKIVPAVSLSSADYHSLPTKYYTFAFKKNKDGEVYDDGLDVWFTNTDSKNPLYLSLDEVQVNGNTVKTKSEYSSEDREYSCSLGTVPPLCTGSQMMMSYDRGRFLPWDVLEENGITEEGKISVSFEIYAEIFSDSFHSSDSYIPELKLNNYEINVRPSVVLSEEKTISFHTRDMDGNEVDSKDIFAGHKVTMISLWASWNGPYVRNIPELVSLNSIFEDEDCQIIGVCLDANESKEKAMTILEENDVTYLNIFPPENVNEALPSKVIPTTYFVDSEGSYLADPVEGFDFERCTKILNELLKTAR